MKKICLLLFVIIVGLTGGICYLLNHSLEQEAFSLDEFKKTNLYVETLLSKEDIVDERVSEGTVIGDGAVEVKEFSYIYEFQIKAETGDIIPADTSVLQYDYYNEVVFPNPVRIIKFDVYTKEIEEMVDDVPVKKNVKMISVTYLDYGKTYVLASFETEYDSIINSSTVFNVIYNEKPLKDVELLQKGYECKEGDFDIMLKTSDLLLPGTKIKVHLPLHNYTDQWTIPNDFVYKDKQGSYLIYLDEDLEQKVYVDVICKTEEKTAVRIDEKYTERTFICENN